MSIYQSFANMVGMSNTIQPCTKDITAITRNTCMHHPSPIPQQRAATLTQWRVSKFFFKFNKYNTIV